MRFVDDMMTSKGSLGMIFVDDLRTSKRCIRDDIHGQSDDLKGRYIVDDIADNLRA